MTQTPDTQSVAEQPSIPLKSVSVESHQRLDPEHDSLQTSSAPLHRRWIGITIRCGLPILFLALGSLAYVKLAKPIEKEAIPTEPPKALRTRIVELEVRDYPVVITTNGTVAPHNQVTINAEVTGQVVRVSPSFQVGAFFEAGEVLLELDNRDYKTALAIAKAQLESAKAALTLAELNYNRQLQLFAKNVGAEAEVNQAKATRSQAVAQLDSLQAQLEQAERDLQRTQITAPFNGRVREKAVGLGQSVAPNTPLGVVFAIDFAEIRLPIAGTELQYLDLPEQLDDPPVPVELRDAINPATSAVWTANIVRTEGALDENTLDLFAIARVDDPFGQQHAHKPLRVEQPVTATIIGKTLKNVIKLPRRAVRQLDQIHLVDETEHTISSRKIEPLWSDASHVIIRDPGIEPGSWLATTRLVYAPEGAKVEILADIPTNETQTAAKESVSTETVNN